MSYVVDAVSDGQQLADSGILEDADEAYGVFDGEVAIAKVATAKWPDMYAEITVRLIDEGNILNETTVAKGEVLASI